MWVYDLMRPQAWFITIVILVLVVTPVVTRRADLGVDILILVYALVGCAAGLVLLWGVLRGLATLF